MEYTIYDALRDSARIDNGPTWLVLDTDGIYTVYSRPAYAKITRTLYNGDDESAAVYALMKDDWEAV